MGLRCKPWPTWVSNCLRTLVVLWAHMTDIFYTLSLVPPVHSNQLNKLKAFSIYALKLKPTDTLTLTSVSQF